MSEQHFSGLFELRLLYLSWKVVYVVDLNRKNIQYISVFHLEHLKIYLFSRCGQKAGQEDSPLKEICVN